MNIRKNDTVEVIAGNSRGKKGRVLKVITESNRIIVEGVNIIQRHTRASQRNPQGGIVKKEASINSSNVMLICPKCSKTTRLGRKPVKDTSTGRNRMMRVCKKCEEMF